MFPHDAIAIPDRIVGKRIVLRPWQKSDAAALYDIISGSRTRLSAWMFWINDHRSLEDTEDFLSYSVSNWQGRRELGLAITERATGRVMGSTGMHNIIWKVPSFEIGYWIGDGDEGKGYVTEAVLMQLALAFDDFRAQRIAVTCDPRNVRSRLIPERLGFRLEGQLRNHMRTPEGLLRDTLVFSMTPDEYRSNLESNDLYSS